MSTIANFPLPDVGEGLTEAEIVSWKVKPGDTVKVNQIVVEIETAKSLVELPCPFAGTVAELFYKEGDTVEVGKPIISVTVADGAVTSAVAVASRPSRLTRQSPTPPQVLVPKRSSQTLSATASPTRSAEPAAAKAQQSPQQPPLSQSSPQPQTTKSSRNHRFANLPKTSTLTSLRSPAPALPARSPAKT